MAELQPIIGFHGRHFVHHLEICNPICVKLLQIMFGVIPRNLKKNDVSISNRFRGVHKRGIYRHVHDDSIRRNAMRCISPKNGLAEVKQMAAIEQRVGRTKECDGGCMNG